MMSDLNRKIVEIIVIATAVLLFNYLKNRMPFFATLVRPVNWKHVVGILAMTVIAIWIAIMAY